MKKWMALLFIPSVSFATPPVVSPSTAVAIIGSTISFTCPDAGTFTLTAGSMGTITKAGLYVAPTTYFTALNISPAGCPLRPNDDIINTRIDALPVDSSSSLRFYHAYHLSSSSGVITFEPTIPTNIYNSATPLQSMVFRYTGGMNGTLFPMLSSATRMEEGSTIPNIPYNDFQDHHILGVDSNTCLASELYGFYPIGANPHNLATNSESGFQYYSNSYQLPDVSGGFAGGADAAGMAIQPPLLRFSEMKSGRINHALRMTLNNVNFYAPAAGNAFDWPATDQSFVNSCTGSENCFHYGARLRLKSTYNCAGFTTPGSRAICVALQQYGAFLVDGGTKFGIVMNYDVTEDTTSFRDIFTLLQSSLTTAQLDQVDESSLMISSFSGVVNPSNAYVTPANFAQVLFTRTSDVAVSSVSIAIQPVTVGWANPAYPGLDSGINVMAGTPQFQIPYWVNGATDTTATCSMTPAIGTLTSDCKYTAPASQYNQLLITTVTVTSNLDPVHAASSFFMTIFSSDAIRVRSGPATSVSDTKPPYNNAGNYIDSTTGNAFFEEPVNMFPNWNVRDTQGSGSWPNQLYNNFVNNTGDKVFSAMVPPGTYQLQMNSGSNSGTTVAASSNCVETQGTIFQSTTSLAPAILVPKVISTYLTVGSDSAFYWAIRGNVLGNHAILSYWSLAPSAAPSPGIILRGKILMNGNMQMRIR